MVAPATTPTAASRSAPAPTTSETQIRDRLRTRLLYPASAPARPSARPTPAAPSPRPARSPATRAKADSRTGCYSTRSPAPTTSATPSSISTIVKVDTSDPAAPTLTLSPASAAAPTPRLGHPRFRQTRRRHRRLRHHGQLERQRAPASPPTASRRLGSSAPTDPAQAPAQLGTYSLPPPRATTNGSQNVTATNNAGWLGQRYVRRRLLDSHRARPAVRSSPSTARRPARRQLQRLRHRRQLPRSASRTDCTETRVSATASGLASSTLVRTQRTFTLARTSAAPSAPRHDHRQPRPERP